VTARRTQPTVVLTAAAPAVLDGKPVMPAHWAVSSSSITATQGAKHIHAIADPDTYKDRSGIVNPPSSASSEHAGPWTARWSVRTLPDPGHYDNGYYWLGSPSSQDGTSTIAAAARQWGPDTSTPGAPSWHSIYPYKPSVTAVDHYLQGGGIVHHPKGVNFNSHFIEHMWMDWGSAHRQPFTWVIAATVASWPSAGYVHYLLDAGRDPRTIGFGPLTAAQCSGDYTVDDNLDYRQLLAIGPNHIKACARPDGTGTGVIRARTNDTLRPRMYVAIFNGDTSHIGVYHPGQGLLRKGSLDNGTDQRHRYYVMGRRHNSISGRHASHLLVFEMRFWTKALTYAQLEGQYDQISSTWQFDKYRNL